MGGGGLADLALFSTALPFVFVKKGERTAPGGNNEIRKPTLGESRGVEQRFKTR